MDNNTNIKLVSFLNELSNSLENNKLSSKQIMRIGEFFMSYQFQEAATKDKEIDEDDEDDNLEFDISELTKFICMGWYIYCVILKNKSLTI